MTAIQRLTLFFRHFLRGSRQFESRLNTLQQGGIIPRFRNKIESPRLHALHRQLDAPPCRHQYNGHIGTKELDLLQQGQPFFSCRGKSEIHIHQDKGRSFHTDYLHRFARTGNSLRHISCPLQHETKRRTYCTIIVNYQYHTIFYLFTVCKNNDFIT